ncbi:MAG: hypothetical protein QXT63_04450 [Thermoplasmata archaeon]
MSKKLRIHHAIALLVLSPVLAELLSGSSPLLEFCNPFVAFLLFSLYGGGPIIVRELVIRWRKVFPSLITLGCAYGIIEEGIMCKSFFNPAWPDVGILGSYGRVLDVNRIWAVELTIFHAFVYITIPIVITSSVYPEYKTRPYVTLDGLKIAFFLFCFVVTFGFIFFPYYPSPCHIFLSLILVFILLFVAKKLPY